MEVLTCKECFPKRLLLQVHVLHGSGEKRDSMVICTQRRARRCDIQWCQLGFKCSRIVMQQKSVPYIYNFYDEWVVGESMLSRGFQFPEKMLEQ